MLRMDRCAMCTSASACTSVVWASSGTYMFREGLERTTKELAARAPSKMKIKVVSPPDLDAITLPLRGSVVPVALLVLLCIRGKTLVGLPTDSASSYLIFMMTNIEEFGTRRNEVLFSMSKIPSDDVLEVVSLRNSKPYWNCTTWRFIKRYRFPTVKS